MIQRDGFLLFDKPAGISSHAALKRVQRLLAIKKAGHTGSLDPLATGMLPLCFNEATKYAQFLLEASKAYRFSMQLGVCTATGDSEGEIVQVRPVLHPDPTQIQNMIAHFLGEQLQMPPMYSALQHQGQRLYRLARQGKVVERPLRPITINALALVGVVKQEASVLTFDVQCSKGTYIRSLVEDMGAYLGCGAHVTQLRRLWVSPFAAFPMVSWEALAQDSAKGSGAPIIPIAKVLSYFFPSMVLSQEQVSALYQGKVVHCALEQEGKIVLLDEQGHFLGLGEGAMGALRSKRLRALRVEPVCP